MSVLDGQIILASSSPYRQHLLKQLGLAFITCSPDIDETLSYRESALSAVRRIATSKARAVAKKYPQAIIVASDQLASLHDQPLGKPGNHERAARQLHQCSGQTVTFYTAVCVLSPELVQEDITTTEVLFRNLNTRQIESYLQFEKPYDCAGSFKCEGLGIALFTQIRSKDPTALIGLPLISLSLMLERIGIDPLLSAAQA